MALHDPRDLDAAIAAHEAGESLRRGEPPPYMRRAVERRPGANRRGLRGFGGGGGAPAAAWLPSDITGVAEWWRADLGVTDAGAGAVSAWQGQIAGETLSQGTAAARPTLTTRDSQSVLSFDGGDFVSGSFGTVTLSGTWQAVVVAELSAVGAIRNAIDGDALARRATLGSTTTGTAWRAITDTVDVVSGGTWDTSPHVLALKATGSTDSSLTVDNLTTPLATGTLGVTAPPQGLVVGANYDGSAARWVGWIWEVILVDQAITSGDLALLGAYLDARYAGLSLTY